MSRASRSSWGCGPPRPRRRAWWVASVVRLHGGVERLETLTWRVLYGSWHVEGPLRGSRMKSSALRLAFGLAFTPVLALADQPTVAQQPLTVDQFRQTVIRPLFDRAVGTYVALPAFRLRWVLDRRELNALQSQTTELAAPSPTSTR